MLIEETQSYAYNKCIGSNNIKRCDSQKPPWIIDASLFENFCCNWNRRVDRVTYYVDQGPRTTLSNSFTKSLHDSSIDVKKIISCHSWFSRNTGRNDYKIHASKSIIQFILPQKSTNLKDTKADKTSSSITIQEIFA